MIAARGHDGHIACFDVTENEHGDHILRRSTVPAAVSATVADEARRIAEKIAEAFGYIGVLAVEMFVVAERRLDTRCWSTRSRRAFTIPGTGRSTAPRCRNSSSTCARSPAGRWRSRSARGRIEMFNLIGDEAEDYRQVAGHAGRVGTPLRQVGLAPWPQDGPRDAGFRREIISSQMTQASEEVTSIRAEFNSRPRGLDAGTPVWSVHVCEAGQI